jgi:hypothetical protein
VTSKVRVKLGQLEVECEGTEEFLRDELPKLLEAFSKLQPTPLRGEHLSETSDLGKGTNGAIGTTATIAGRIGCKTGPELMIAAAARLTLGGAQETFTRKDWLAEMKSAKSYFKKTMESNFTVNAGRLVKGGEILEVTDGEYSLAATKLTEVKEKLAQV